CAPGHHPIILRTIPRKETITMWHMFIDVWLALFDRETRKHRTRRYFGFRREAYRPRVEALEDRNLPSTLTVTNPRDDGSVGSLRYEMSIAQSGDKIVFADSMAGQTITTNPAYGELSYSGHGNTDLTIQGPGGADRVTISGGGQSRIFSFGFD